MYATAISSGDFNGYTGHVPARNESKKRWNLSQKRYWLTIYTDKNCNGDVTRKVKKKKLSFIEIWKFLRKDNWKAKVFFFFFFPFVI